jgi:hypothetical protein
MSAIELTTQERAMLRAFGTAIATMRAEGGSNLLAYLPPGAPADLLALARRVGVDADTIAALEQAAATPAAASEMEVQQALAWLMDTLARSFGPRFATDLQAGMATGEAGAWRVLADAGERLQAMAEQMHVAARLPPALPQVVTVARLVALGLQD